MFRLVQVDFDYMKNKSHTTFLSRVTMDKSVSVKVSEICWWGSNQLALKSSPNFCKMLLFTGWSFVSPFDMCTLKKDWHFVKNLTIYF